MSLRKIHLRKLLAAFGSSDRKLTSLLRTDIRHDIAKENGETDGGGDFHGPFWADAKAFVLDGRDLDLHTQARVEANKRRGRLYPVLKAGFLDWWRNKKRFSNQHIEPHPTATKASFKMPDLDATVKVDNFLGLSVGDEGKRLIYPYFAEEPALTADNARLGLWLISKAFPKQPIGDFRILDVLRGKSYSIEECSFLGNEESSFKAMYQRLITRWEELRTEY